MNGDKTVWLEDLVKHRKFLFQCVLSAGASEHSPNRGVKRDCGCSDRVYPRPHEIDRHHDPRCKHGLLLRQLGGPEVALRQLNASHELALMMSPEEARLGQLAVVLLEIILAGDWMTMYGYVKEVEELRLRNLIEARVVTAKTQARFIPQASFPTPKSIHETKHLIRTTRAHEQCWDCDMYSLHGEDSPGHCRHCDQDWPPSGPCVA